MIDKTSVFSQSISNKESSALTTFFTYLLSIVLFALSLHLSLSELLYEYSFNWFIIINVVIKVYL